VAAGKPRARSHDSPMDTSRAVDEFMAGLDHPFKAEIEAIRAAILGVDSAIAEGIKWLAKDRAMVLFTSLADFASRKAEFERILRQWIVHVG